MSRAATLSSINCTQCGAGLGVLGGGRVRTHVCGYCGAVLDAQDSYKVLTSIGKRDHPASPVKIGMTCPVDGVPFTVIGTLGMVETYGGRTWRWVEHQLFSPTHGYGWLSYEDGNLLFTRKIRDLPRPSWISSAQVERAETPPKAQLGGVSYRYYETTTARIDFMEGEFNWQPELDETSTAVTLLSDVAMLSFVNSKSEQEIELTTLLPHAETMAALGAEPDSLRKPLFHPLTPFQAFAQEGFVRTALLGFAAAALCVAMAFAVMGGTRVLAVERIPVASLPQEFAFDVGSTTQLLRVEVQSDVNNSYALFTTEIIGPEGAPLAEGARATEYYTGVEGGERWSEGSRRASFLLRPEAIGPHRIVLDLEEAESWQGRHTPVSTVSLRVDDRVATYFWLLVLSGLFALGPLILTARRMMHKKRRWSGSDWTDEE